MVKHADLVKNSFKMSMFLLVGQVSDEATLCGKASQVMLPFNRDERDLVTDAHFLLGHDLNRGSAKSDRVFAAKAEANHIL